MRDQKSTIISFTTCEQCIIYINIYIYTYICTDGPSWLSDQHKCEQTDTDICALIVFVCCLEIVYEMYLIHIYIDW